jgi:uncharacterized membrane protein YkoI
MKRKIFIIALLPLFILFLATYPGLAQNDVNPNDGIDISEAEVIALSLYPEATVILSEREVEDGVPAWDVKLDNGMAVYVNAATGAVIESEPWQYGWGARIPSAVMVEPVTNPDAIDIGDDGVDVQEAQSIALSYYPDATVVEVDRDIEGGINLWDVMLDNGMAVYLNAVTGALIEFEPWNPFGRSWDNDERDGWGGPPPWAGFPGGRRAWEASQGEMPGGASNVAGDIDGTTTGGTATGGTATGGTATITFEQALEIALNQYPNTTLVEGELTRRGPWNRGALAWDLELSNGMAVYVDATTGTILEVERWR